METPENVGAAGTDEYVSLLLVPLNVAAAPSVVDPHPTLTVDGLMPFVIS